MPRQPAPNMMDDVHRWSFQTKASAQARVAHGPGTVTAEARGVQARYRAILRKAQRFVVDDEAVRLVCHLSHEDQRLLEGWSFLARIPYDHLWIEFNLHEKVRELHRIGMLASTKGGVPLDLSTTSTQMGLLLYLDGEDTRSRWVCHMFYRGTEAFGGEDEISPVPLAFVFDPEGSPLTPLRGSSLWHSPTLSLRPGFPKMPIRVQHDPRREGGWHFNPAMTKRPDVVMEEVIAEAKRVGPDIYELAKQADPEINVLGLWEWDDGAIRSPAWLGSRAAVIIDPWREAYQKDRAQLYDLALWECSELAGQMRWVLTLLAAINNLPKDVKPVLSAGRQVVGMNVLPYLQHATVSINLPKDDKVRHARVSLNKLARNAQRAWHKVIGHWRIIERGKPLPSYYCRHIPTMVENGLGICEKCEMLIRWIHEHERGDPELGMVDHTYNVHGPRQRARATTAED
jgi:hypothetical protein